MGIEPPSCSRLQYGGPETSSASRCVLPNRWTNCCIWAIVLRTIATTLSALIYSSSSASRRDSRRGPRRSDRIYADRKMRTWRKNDWKMEKKVVDSVPEFPYACAVQYRQVRGRTLLPGSGWDRVLPRRYGRLTRTMHGWLVYNFFSNAIEPDSAGSRMWVCPDRPYSYIPRITKPRVEGGSRSMALDIAEGAYMISSAASSI